MKRYIAFVAMMVTTVALMAQKPKQTTEFGAANLPDDVPTREKERRNQVLLDDQERRGQRRNDRLVGTVREVLSEGPSKRNLARWSGRDSGNRIVVWDAARDAPTPPPGTPVCVRVTEAHPQILVGDALKPTV